MGIVGSEIYTAIKVITEELGSPDQYTNGVSWYHFSYGVSSIITGVITGKQYMIAWFSWPELHIFRGETV